MRDVDVDTNRILLVKIALELASIANIQRGAPTNHTPAYALGIGTRNGIHLSHGPPL